MKSSGLALSIVVCINFSLRFLYQFHKHSQIVIGSTLGGRSSSQKFRHEVGMPEHETPGSGGNSSTGFLHLLFEMTSQGWGVSEKEHAEKV
jgi:hypothetical protein